MMIASTRNPTQDSEGVYGLQAGASSCSVSVLIVDDCTLYREGLAAIIPSESAVADVRAAHDLGSLHASIGSCTPDVILLNLASIGSRTLLSTARTISPESRLIVIGVSEDDEEQIVACAEAGVAGYHLRTESLHDLLQLIQAVAMGETKCSPRVTAVLLRRLSALAARHRPASTVLTLTAREDQILRLLHVGLSNRQIATRLCIEVHTVKNHVHSVLVKLGVRTRAEAAAVLESTSMSPAHT